MDADSVTPEQFAVRWQNEDVTDLLPDLLATTAGLKVVAEACRFLSASQTFELRALYCEAASLHGWWQEFASMIGKAEAGLSAELRRQPERSQELRSVECLLQVGRMRWQLGTESRGLGLRYAAQLAATGRGYVRHAAQIASGTWAWRTSDTEGACKHLDLAAAVVREEMDDVCDFPRA